MTHGVDRELILHLEKQRLVLTKENKFCKNIE